jgi:hypothetical protein
VNGNVRTKGVQVAGSALEPRLTPEIRFKATAFVIIIMSRRRRRKKKKTAMKGEAEFGSFPVWVNRAKKWN